MKILLPIFYLPPVSWFSVFLHHDSEVVLEQYENFPKQTYRNRANIYGANGKLSLIIPIHHNGKRAMKDIEISYSENWQHLHWKSIKNAYQSSPYFEFYEDHLKQIFDSEEKSLIKFNLRALEIILKLLKTEKAYSLNDEYARNPAEINYREKFSAKQPSEFEMEEYYQTFSDKLGFLADLSIIDLLCNKGPESLTYIQNIKL
ncbi:WbqC-like protein family [Chryseobacterium taklimakanense]|uniref:WbqC-like protein family n=1 Tax=Chryseobacterium taklimakanense TaxID=536441 RepID=A0A239XX65_9FLAO|nr:WbqC family protein [Chryseobacterium taklimakanense]SNV50990.1 WbqC-like protein family [Chryseobacterium taklimakanense]